MVFTGVAGQIVDEKGTPVTSASVKLDGKELKLESQATFRKLLPTGSYILEVCLLFKVVALADILHDLLKVRVSVILQAFP